MLANVIFWKVITQPSHWYDDSKFPNQLNILNRRNAKDWIKTPGLQTNTADVNISCNRALEDHKTCWQTPFSPVLLGSSQLCLCAVSKSELHRTQVSTSYFSCFQTHASMPYSLSLSVTQESQIAAGWLYRRMSQIGITWKKRKKKGIRFEKQNYSSFNCGFWFCRADLCLFLQSHPGCPFPIYRAPHASPRTSCGNWK